jgi:FKBP-type peptidyl-prolyl cis-trans isomerase (trigger factor)
MQGVDFWKSKITESIQTAYGENPEEADYSHIYDAAAETLRGKAVVEKIAELENLSVDEDDMEKAFAMLAMQNGMPVEFIKEHCDDGIKKEISGSVLIGKVMRLIRESAVVEIEVCEHHHCHCH